MQHDGWTVIDESAGVLWREYVFGGGKATSLTFRMADGLAVVSPPNGLEPRAFDALAEIGNVRALIANNSFHNLGQAAWRTRFPDAKSYCPAGAVASLGKKVKGATFHPLSALELPAGVRCEEMAGMRSGETFVSVKTDRGNVWFTGDVLTNFDKLPKAPLRWLFTWTDSGPGYRLFKPNAWIFVKNGGALKKWLEDRIAAVPPAIVVPAHGPAFEAPDLKALTEAQLRKL